MKLSWRGEAPSLVLLALVVATGVWGWLNLPDRIPLHSNLQGEVDRYGSKFEGLIIFPIVAAGLYLLFLGLPRIDPGRANYARFAGAYQTLRHAFLGYVLVLYATMVASTAGLPIDLRIVIGLAVAALFVVLGSVMGRVRPNWFVGIRTPWTLSSERSWTATHRWGGRLFIVLGLLLGAAMLSGSDIVLIAVVAGACVGLLGLVIYSYRVWRSDPGRLALPGEGSAEGPSSQ